MLYATTRSKTDTYTDYRTLIENRAPDGGYFLPFRMPKLDITHIKQQSFSETVAFVLDLFFAGRISPWDVECCIGKNPVNALSVNRKIILAKLWDNPFGDYRYICNRLFDKLCKGDNGDLTDWAYIAIRISVLFGIFGILQKQNIQSFDICINSGDFSDPMAAWYARYMGLPIEKIICTCNENGAPWDLLHRGEINTGIPTLQTGMPDLEFGNPPALERLIFSALGSEQTQMYLNASSQKRVYHIQPDQMQQLNDGFFVSVVGKDRPESVISAFFSTNDIILDPYTALACGGLQDYRSKTGESNPTVLLWDRSPIHFLSSIQNATGMTQAEIEKYIKMN